MLNYSIKDIARSTDRYKLYLLLCERESLAENIAFVQGESINVVNIGKELAAFISGQDNPRYLNIDVYEYTKKLFDKHKSKIGGVGNEVLAIYNLGILIEPALTINVEQLLKEVSKSTALILIWENHYDISDKLTWPTQKNNIVLDFAETPLKKLQYAI